MNTFGSSGANSLTAVNSNPVKTKTPAESNTAHAIVFTNSSLRNQSENRTAASPSNMAEAPNDDASPAERSLLSKMTSKGLSDMPGYVADQLDTSSPLHSVKSFEELGLKPELLKSKTSDPRTISSISPGDLLSFSFQPSLKWDFGNQVKFKK